MKTIPLTQGMVTIVDETDYAIVSQYKWYADKHGRSYRARGSIQISESKRIRILMHRFILNAPRGVEVDHRNGNGLDNRRVNLRFCTHAENGRNRRLNCNNKTGFKGIYFDNRKLTKPYLAQIRVNTKSVTIGRYQTIEAAVRAYDLAALKYHGRFALTNKMLGLL